MWHHYDGRCHWCGERMDRPRKGRDGRKGNRSPTECTFEHLVRHADGGDFVAGVNVVLAHRKCNNERHPAPPQSLSKRLRSLFFRVVGGKRPKDRVAVWTRRWWKARKFLCLTLLDRYPAGYMLTKWDIARDKRAGKEYRLSHHAKVRMDRKGMRVRGFPVETGRVHPAQVLPEHRVEESQG